MAAEDAETITYEHSCPDVVPLPPPAFRNVGHDGIRRRGEEVVGPREAEVVNDRYVDHEEQSQEEDEELQHVRDDRLEQPDQHFREDHPGATGLPVTDHVAADAGTSTSTSSSTSSGLFAFLCSACSDTLGCGNGSGACTFMQQKRNLRSSLCSSTAHGRFVLFNMIRRGGRRRVQ